MSYFDLSEIHRPPQEEKPKTVMAKGWGVVGESGRLVLKSCVLKCFRALHQNHDFDQETTAALCLEESISFCSLRRDLDGSSRQRWSGGRRHIRVLPWHVTLWPHTDRWRASKRSFTVFFLFCIQRGMLCPPAVWQIDFPFPRGKSDSVTFSPIRAHSLRQREVKGNRGLLQLLQ